ncbi:hypothetical protein Efla_001930 [Eimeria flavescens]
MPVSFEPGEAASSDSVADGSIFLPFNAEEFHPGFPSRAITPVEAYLTSQGPLVTPDACPLLSFEDDRRVRFRECDEEWLLTEEISVTSASARWSEEASAADSRNAMPEIPSPILAAEIPHGMFFEKRPHFASCEDNATKKVEHHVEMPSAESCKAGLQRGSVGRPLSSAKTGESREQGGVASCVSLQFWWTARADPNAGDSQQSCLSSGATNCLEAGMKRDRRHTAPGALKTALIRSCEPRVSHQGALVDIAALDMD